MKFKESYVQKVVHLADYVVSSWDPKMKWMWGEALLGYALDELPLRSLYGQSAREARFRLE